MKQTIVVAKPPVYDECVAAFGRDAIVGKPILWAWGDKIYNPLDIDIPRELLAHEAVHGARQLGQVESWWELYLKDAAFRYNEEVLAHRAEWRNLVKWNRQSAAALDAIAARLASPLYGKMCSMDGARFALSARAG